MTKYKLFCNMRTSLTAISVLDVSASFKDWKTLLNQVLIRWRTVLINFFLLFNGNNKIARLTHWKMCAHRQWGALNIICKQFWSFSFLVLLRLYRLCFAFVFNPLEPTSMWIFSLLLSLNFHGCWQGEFAWQSRVSSIGDHPLYSIDLNVGFRGKLLGDFGY